ncbi:MAG TPA: GNAT family N-acetyltransferase [Phycisphaerae bacterium]|nr:GNAT family N-acetyltransferase [Phycisphaerae bacterium]
MPADGKQPAGLLIEPLELDPGRDVRAVAALLALSWKGCLDEADIDRRQAALVAELESLDPARRRLSVASVSGRTVGFCRVLRDADTPDHWWLAGVVTHPDHRGAGIGRALVRESLEHARSHGATLIRSEAHIDNPASIAFHEALGFRNEGAFLAADGDGKVAFSLPLSQP